MILNLDRTRREKRTISHFYTWYLSDTAVRSSQVAQTHPRCSMDAFHGGGGEAHLRDNTQPTVARLQPEPAPITQNLKQPDGYVAGKDPEECRQEYEQCTSSNGPCPDKFGKCDDCTTDCNDCCGKVSKAERNSCVCG